jgi:hypothetical protein
VYELDHTIASPVEMGRSVLYELKPYHRATLALNEPTGWHAVWPHAGPPRPREAAAPASSPGRNGEECES